MFRYKVALAVLASASIGWSAAAHANTFSFTASGTSQGNPISAMATVTTESGEIVVSITNTLVNPTDVSQNISDFEIFLNSALTGTPTYNGTQTNTTATVASGGNFTTGSSNNTWSLTNPVSNEIFLNDLTAGACGPSCTILGQPGAGGLYTNANGSIAGNGPHNPFFWETGSFDILAPGVTASTAVTGATFSFGTVAGNDVPGVSSTPLPGAFALFGSVLFGGLGVSRWRKRRARGPVSVIA